MNFELSAQIVAIYFSAVLITALGIALSFRTGKPKARAMKASAKLQTHS